MYTQFTRSFPHTSVHDAEKSINFTPGGSFSFCIFDEDNSGSKRNS